jgi:hypothetical protein
MKYFSVYIISVVVLLYSCNHKPVQQEELTQTDPVKAVLAQNFDSFYDSVLIEQPISAVYYHHFSDSLAQDSFVIEIPAGDILSNELSFRIYSQEGRLLFQDWLSSEFCLGSATNNSREFTEQQIVNSLKQYMSHFFDLPNFVYAYENEAIKEASGDRILNMIGWTEAVNDPHRMTFKYYKNPEYESYVAYSYKLGKGVIIFNGYQHYE